MGDWASLLMRLDIAAESATAIMSEVHGELHRQSAAALRAERERADKAEANHRSLRQRCGYDRDLHPCACLFSQDPAHDEKPVEECGYHQAERERADEAVAQLAAEKEFNIEYQAEIIRQANEAKAQAAAMRVALEKIEAALRKDSRDKSIVGDGVEYHLDGQTMGYAINLARQAIATDAGKSMLAVFKAAELLHKLADELCTAVDLADEDIGGARPMDDILAEFGPATDALGSALAALVGKR